MIEVTIPNYRLVQDNKPHYVYTIKVLSANYQESVEKRYSAFHAFHREVRDPPPNPSPITTHTLRCSPFRCLIAEEVHIHATVPVQAHTVLPAESPRTEEGRPGEIPADGFQNRRRLQTSHGIPRPTLSAQVNTAVFRIARSTTAFLL